MAEMSEKQKADERAKAAYRENENRMYHEMHEEKHPLQDKIAYTEKGERRREHEDMAAAARDFNAGQRAIDGDDAV